MAHHATLVPPVSAGMSAEYLGTFIETTVSTGTLIQVLERGPNLVLIWKD
jgi:creatinine amidohydrolase/Fe(II)-dependent formamide hydrolase-like protein|tara:strand:+ start:317 stop:466 length:150 start_codon:yes stop_codon:yes gene_type:complete